MSGTRNLGSLVVRLALELAQYRTDWQQAETVTTQGAQRVDQASRGAAAAADVLKDALKRQTEAFGGTAAGAGELAAEAGVAAGATTALAVGVGAAVAAVGGLAVAAYQGAKEQRALADSLLLTGNYAGMVSGQLDRMAMSLASSIGGTVGSAREVLAGLVATGRFTSESLQEVGAAVQLVARYSGQSEQEVLKHFAGMADGVAKWAAKANESYHFLDLGTYRYIQRLEEQGRVQDAMRVSSEALINHLGKDVTQNLGVLEQAWQSLERAASRAWAAMKGVGKETTNSDRLEELERYIAQAERGWMANTPQGQDQLRQLRLQADQIRALVDVERIEAQAKTDQAQATEKAIKVDKEWAKVVDDNATKLQRMNKELENARRLAESKMQNAGTDADRRLIEAQLAQAEAQIRERYAERAKKGPADPYDNLIKSAKERVATLQAELESNDKLTESERQRAKYQADLAAGYIKFNDAKHEAYMRELDLMAAGEKALELRAREKKEQDEATKEYEQKVAAIEKATERLQDETEKQKLHTASIGATKEQIAELTAAKLEEDAVSKERLATLMDEIDLSGKMGDAYREQAKALRELAQAKRADAQKAAGQEALEKEAKEFAKFMDGVDDTFRDGFREMLQHGEDGWEAWLKSLRNTAKVQLADELYRMFARPFVVNVLAQVTGVSGGAVQRALGGSGIGGVGSGGILDLSQFGIGPGGVLNMSGMLGSFNSGGGIIGSIGSALGLNAGVAGGSFASTIGGGLATDALGATVIEGAAGATLGSSALGGALSAIGTALPWVGAAMAVASLFEDKGGPKLEGGFSAGGRYAIDERGDVAAARQISQSIGTTYEALAKQLGLLNQKLDVGVWFAMDPEGDAKTQLNVVSNSYDRQARLGGDENVERGEEALQAAVAEETTRVIFEALKASEISGMYRAWLNAVAADAGVTEMQEVIARISKASAEKQALELRIWELTATAEEKLARAREQELATLDESNRALAERVYALQDEAAAMETLRADLMDAYNSESAALQRVVDQNQAYAESLRRLQQSLRAGPLAQLSPEAAYHAARDEFLRLAALPAGDEERLANLPAAGEAFLEASQAYNATSLAYFEDLEQVMQAAHQSEIHAKANVDVAQLQLNAMKDQLELLGLIKDGVMTFAEALQAYLAGQLPGAEDDDAAGGGTTLAGARADPDRPGHVIVPSAGGTSVPVSRIRTTSRGSYIGPMTPTLRALTPQESSALWGFNTETVRASAEYAGAQALVAELKKEQEAKAAMTPAEMVAKLVASVPQYETGIDTVPSRQLALLHPHETVLNRRAAARWREQQAGGGLMHTQGSAAAERVLAQLLAENRGMRTELQRLAVVSANAAAQQVQLQREIQENTRRTANATAFDRARVPAKVR